MRAHPSRTAAPAPPDPDFLDHRPPETAGRVAAVAFSVLLLVPVRGLLDSHPSAWRLSIVLAGAAAFAVVFLWRLVFAPMADSGSRSTWIWLGVALALAVALVVGDGPPRWAPLFIFLSAIVGVRIPLPAAAWGIAACTIVAAGVLVPTAPFANTATVSLEALGIGALMAGAARLRATITELQESRQQLARLAVTEERLRIARDLHDLLGHSLSLIALKADLAGQLLPTRVERAAKEVADIDAVARRALAEVREAVSGYRQPTLAEAVATGRQALDVAGIDTTWEIAQVALPDGVDAVLGWALREAVTNVIRHSRASHCSVRVSAGLLESAIEVIDDGIGLPPQAVGPFGSAVGESLTSSPTPAGLAPAGNGLRGLSERLAALGGRLEVAACSGGGAKLRASVPTSASRAPASTPPPVALSPVLGDTLTIPPVAP